MSTTGPNEGTLQVFPDIAISSAYVILRPFFKAIKSLAELNEDRAAYLAAENWTLDLDSSDFPNSAPGHGQELNDETHPHLDLRRTMLSVPIVSCECVGSRDVSLMQYLVWRLSLVIKCTGTAT